MLVGFGSGYGGLLLGGFTLRCPHSNITSEYTLYTHSFNVVHSAIVPFTPSTHSDNVVLTAIMLFTPFTRSDSTVRMTFTHSKGDWYSSLFMIKCGRLLALV